MVYTYTDFSGSKLPEDNTLSNRTLVLLSSAITYNSIIIQSRPVLTKNFIIFLDSYRLNVTSNLYNKECNQDYLRISSILIQIYGMLCFCL